MIPLLFLDVFMGLAGGLVKKSVLQKYDLPLVLLPFLITHHAKISATRSSRIHSQG